MKVKAITNELLSMFSDAKREYRTPDGTRIDVAVPSKGLAIELESTYSWIDRRVLFDAIKAKRAGFTDLVIIYPFNDNVIQRSWTIKYVQELGVNLRIIKPAEISKLLETKEIKEPKIEKIKLK
ncbi:MAG TPA: hypothetical protein VI790_02010 [Candidatus Nanoarchaeia archaeon]|nr:hypothetical protein [Candidatus Nanoarchaeia archaeon]